MAAPGPVDMTLLPDEKYEIAVSYGTIIGTGVFAIVVCSTKLYIRKFMLNSFGIDDWACLVGLIFVTTFNGIGLAVVYYGAGKHIQHVTPDELKHWFMLYYVCICLYLSISFAVKSSILLFLRRVFPVPYVQWTTMILLVFFTLFTISGTFVAAFQCNPPKYTYDINFLMSPDRAKHCFPAMTSYGIFMYQAVLIFACDIIMFVLPFPALMSVQLNSRKSLALLAVFGSGVVACIAPAIRFKSLNFYKTGSTDTTFEGASSLYWMAIEYNMGLVAGSLPALRPLFSRLGMLGSSNDPASKDPNQFSPSYQLDDQNSKHWANSRRTQASKNRFQGDSVLDATVIDHDDRDTSSRDSEDARIVKTEVFTVTTEARNPESRGNPQAWSHFD
ncbi:hypothetical protein MKX07_003942 [Trichoderma sp. CBMAI-0711]|uniref:PTH11-like G-protein-coupled receptor n=1 Tax=Trichoderma parareesei TaxID=858221 RepID=A0A2H2Z3U5_TRIPA|nr:hypothetical protein MKX07_003942 [Trichoderma sp. CBMAI-0711]OTA00222.1 PTH11-like G-protein-coupled receptor [Trichoderma parareesei]